MPSLIHSNIPQNDYEVLHDSGAIKDSETLFVSRKRNILFHGSEAQLIAAFPIGSGSGPGISAGARSPSGGGGMMCGGLTSAELCEGTRYDPHWEAEVNWVGIHGSYLRGTDKDDFCYKLVYNFARKETDFPIKSSGPPASGSSENSEFTMVLGPPFVQGGVTSPIGGFKRCRLINYVPMIQVVGVIKHMEDTPLTPLSGSIMSLITGTLNGKMRDPNIIQDWSSLVDPLYTYAKIFLDSGKQNGALGGFVPVNMSSHRHLSFGPIHAFTLDCTWEQGLSPG